MIRALIDTWRYEGYMPDGRSGFWNGEVQGGSNSDNVLADAYVKGLRGGINWTAGYKAMRKNAEVLPINTFSHDDESASVKEGRGALDRWLEHGYVSADSTRCISRTTEYAVNDYALSVVAAGEAPQDVVRYRNRSAGWQLLWKDDLESRGFQGFLAPKNPDGSWNLTDYDVLMCGSPDCGFLAYTFQTVPFEQSFILPMDMQSVVKKMGGAAEFERRLAAELDKIVRNTHIDVIYQRKNTQVWEYTQRGNLSPYGTQENRELCFSRRSFGLRP